MLAWHHEHMQWRLGVEVTNGNKAFVLMDQLGWNVAGDDFAEEAVVVGHGEIQFTIIAELS